MEQVPPTHLRVLFCSPTKGNNGLVVSPIPDYEDKCRGCQEAADDKCAGLKPEGMEGISLFIDICYPIVSVKVSHIILEVYHC